MLDKEYVCCICGDIFNGYGNNPWGAIQPEPNGVIKELEFNDNDRCCDECNNQFVIPGRLWHMRKRAR